MTTTQPPSASTYPGTTTYSAPSYASPPAAAPPTGSLQRPADSQQTPLQPTPDPNVPAQPPQNRTFDPPAAPADNNKPTENGKPVPESRLLLPPQSEPASSNSNRALRGLDPEDQDRFTAVPMRQVWAMKPVTTALRPTATPVQMTPTKQTLPTTSIESNPWRAARP
jgi:hypothetical protein